MPVDRFDVAIVGAGPAGALAAILLARGGRRVVLIERAAWPRAKTCGGCLSAPAARILQNASLSEILTHAAPLHLARWHVGKQQLSLPTPGGYAIARADFDARLVSHAVGAGATFLPNTAATLEPDARAGSHRTLTLVANNITQTISAAIVLAADGIAGTFLAREPWARWHIAENAYIGVAATCDDFPTPPPPGEIHMHAGAGGYVGLVGLPDARTHLAAAIDPAAARAAGGPAQLVAQILTACHRPAPTTLPHLLGTPYLTRRRAALGGHRVLAIGDACSYVEPFTGEGIAWALQSARAAVSILAPPHAVWPADLPHRWLALHRRTIAHQQWLCRSLRPMIHAPALTAAGLVVGNALPPLRRFIAAQCS